MSKHLLTIAIVALASQRAEAKPVWCAPVDGKLMHGNLKDALTSTDPRVAIPSIVDVLCHARANTEEAQRAREVEAARQRMMKRLDMTEVDWRDAAEWASEHQGKLASTTLDYDPKRAPSALTPIEQFVAIARADDDASYVADAIGAKLTEVGRLSYITYCFSTRRGPVDWAICQPDIDRFDRKRFAAQLRGTGTGYERMALRIDLVELDAKLAAHAANVKAALAKDPAYAAVFSTAASAIKNWKPDAKLVELATAMDDARITNSRRAFDGCHDKTWAALRAAISAIPAQQVEVTREPGGMPPLERAAGIVANTPNGYLAALAYVTCKRAGDKHDYLTRSLGAALVRWPGFRGPRTAALTAIMNAGIELDDRDAELEFPRISREWLGGATGSSSGGEGVVASVKVNGATAVITFAKKMVQGTMCTSYKSSNRIVQIRPDGVIVYDEWCVARKSVTYDTSSPPQTVNAQYVAHLKKGMVASIVEDVVTFAWTKNGAKHPSLVAGVEVK